MACSLLVHELLNMNYDTFDILHLNYSTWATSIEIPHWNFFTWTFHWTTILELLHLTYFKRTTSIKLLQLNWNSIIMCTKMTNEQLLLVMKRKAWRFRIHKDRSTGKNETQCKLRSLEVFAFNFIIYPWKKTLFNNFIGRVTWKKFQSYCGHILLTTEISANSFFKVSTSILNYCKNHHS